MGLGDGGAHVGIICDANFITSLITHWGSRSRSRREDRPTNTYESNSVKRYGSRSRFNWIRGTLELGMKADVNIIDFENLSVRLPEIVNDLPASGTRLQQRAERLSNDIS